jgi:prepilin-type N-terminal cleavage/methylation domain-containing protein/prepilin-type processing-associated H-X9-DG protein
VGSLLFTRSNTSCRRCGFTLVELLVVITIIGMLVALLLPAVGRVRESARQAECLNNIRNLAQAMANYDSSKGQLPGYSQPVNRGATRYVRVQPKSGRWIFATAPNLENSVPVSWATRLLPEIERQDIWDQVVDSSFEPEIRPIKLFVCPSDDGARAVSDVPALTYSVNAGAPDFDGKFLIGAKGSNFGDTTDNGLFTNVYEHAWLKLKAPVSRLSGIDDGAATTIMLAENVHKTYDPPSSSAPPRFSWGFGTEQHLAIVWVASNPPRPGDTYVDQEAINRVGEDVYDDNPMYDPNMPRFARPASNHSGGVNVAFGDAHVEFLRENIDYVVYQQLLTPNGKKCVDPRDHSAGVNPPEPTHPIYQFRRAPPLSEEDYL